MYIYIYSSVAKICKRTKTHNDNTNKTTSAGTKKISLVKMNGDQKRTLIDNKYWKG